MNDVPYIDTAVGIALFLFALWYHRAKSKK